MKEQVWALAKARHEHTVFKSLGIEIVKLDADESSVALTIDDRHRQHLGLVHGGVYVLLAESAASLAGACLLNNNQESVVALEINANHLSTSGEGSLVATATPLHQGRTTMVYAVRVVNGQKLVSIARCTLMRVTQGDHSGSIGLLPEK